MVRGISDEVLIFTVDQQLYKITVGILFNQHSYFKCCHVPIFGGMHMLMNFIHAVAIILDGSGLKKNLASTFGSVDNMLSGKKYPQNYRALRLSAEELLRDVVQQQSVTSFTRLIELLDGRASRSRTTKVWIDSLIKAVIIMMSFSRVTHEGDWALHLLASESMLPYFRSAGCHNYARYAAFFDHHMKGLSPDVVKKLQNGAFVRHVRGIYNSIWTDILIGTT